MKQMQQVREVMMMMLSLKRLCCVQRLAMETSR
jgi:hypothetical protein